MHMLNFRILLLVGVLFLVAACVTPPPPPPSTVVVREVPRGQWMNGEAVWYGELYHGRRTSSGEQFDMRLLTGSHTTIPFGEKVEVVNPANGNSVVIVINDRGHLERGLDLAISKAAAEQLGLVGQRRFAVNYMWLE